MIISSVLLINQIKAQDYTDECPTAFGFYADAIQCDRYYECKDGEVSFSTFVIFCTIFGCIVILR